MHQNPTEIDAILSSDAAPEVPEDLYIAAVTINSALIAGALLRLPLYAALRGVSRQAVHNDIRKQRISSVRIGDQRYIPVRPESRAKVRQAVSLMFPAEIQPGAQSQENEQ